MINVKLRYTVKKRGKLFWQPTPEMRKLGFEPKALGVDGPLAHAEAIRLYRLWLSAKAGEERSRYAEGTFGAYWDHFRKTPLYTKKSARTREDYERAWKHIDGWRPAPGAPALSHTKCSRITTELCERFVDHLDRTLSASERHRTVKWLKVLLADMVVRMRFGYASPAAKIVNSQPKGRFQIWLGAEIEDLAAIAAIAGFEGMSLAIETAWETMFSPVDVRTLRPSQLKRDGEGFYVMRRRTKTDAEAFAAISTDLGLALLAYIERQARAEADDTPIFRTREAAYSAAGGRPAASIAYKTKDLFAKDFRAVRSIMFPDDDRQLLDIRRSANVEADAAGADKKTMGELLANGLADNKFLAETYTPPTVAKAREVALKRLDGRAKLAGEVARLRGANG